MTQRIGVLTVFNDFLKDAGFEAKDAGFENFSVLTPIHIGTYAIFNFAVLFLSTLEKLLPS